MPLIRYIITDITVHVRTYFCVTILYKYQGRIEQTVLVAVHLNSLLSHEFLYLENYRLSNKSCPIVWVYALKEKLPKVLWHRLSKKMIIQNFSTKDFRQGWTIICGILSNKRPMNGYPPRLPDNFIYREASFQLSFEDMV